MDFFDDDARYSSTLPSPFPFSLPDDAACSAHWNSARRGYEIVVPNGELFYAERFFDQKISDRCVEYFQENDDIDWKGAYWKAMPRAALAQLGFRNIAWKQDAISLYRKTVPLPRLTAWYGDPGASYTYSGITSHPNPWNKGLLHLKNEIEQAAGVVFNSVLLNWYRDGDDHMSWHADDERALGINPVIASANFGETRDFVLRRLDDKSRKLVLPLGHGTLLLMKGELQHFWEHSVPRRKRVEGSRFNLTFRRIVRAG